MPTISFSFQIANFLQIMKINITCCSIWMLYIMYIQISFATGIGKGKGKRWFIGRTPPSIFEYSRINGFYSPKQAQLICEKDIQCGGFTFKGPKKIKHFIPEVYFFHFINGSSTYLTTDIRYPHWTSYIVGSKDHIVISGSYPSHDNNTWHATSRYDSVTRMHTFCFNFSHPNLRLVNL